jgi:hypothetical protein
LTVGEGPLSGVTLDLSSSPARLGINIMVDTDCIWFAGEEDWDPFWRKGNTLDENCRWADNGGKSLFYTRTQVRLVGAHGFSESEYDEYPNRMEILYLHRPTGLYMMREVFKHGEDEEGGVVETESSKVISDDVALKWFLKYVANRYKNSWPSAIRPAAERAGMIDPPGKADHTFLAADLSAREAEIDPPDEEDETSPQAKKPPWEEAKYPDVLPDESDPNSNPDRLLPQAWLEGKWDGIGRRPRDLLRYMSGHKRRRLAAVYHAVWGEDYDPETRLGALKSALHKANQYLKTIAYQYSLTKARDEDVICWTE